MDCTQFPYNRNSLTDRCRRTHALLDGVSIAKLCRTWRFEQVIEALIKNVPAAAQCLEWSDAQTQTITERLTNLRDALIESNRDITFYDLLTTNSDTWGGQILARSTDLRSDIMLAYLYVPDNVSRETELFKQDIKDLFDRDHMLNTIGNTGPNGKAKTLRYYYETPRADLSEREIELVTLARRNGVFEPFNRVLKKTDSPSPYTTCSNVEPSVFNEPDQDDEYALGANGDCHYWDEGEDRWRCRMEPHHNCDLTGNPQQPTAFSDLCPDP